jgi:ferredoxin/flavodoxin---NADP+ reductase
LTHVITQACCNDAACVPVCPADCIHPATAAEGLSSAEMLWIDPDECIDCGACTDVCPVDAIYPENELPEELKPFVEINSMFAHLRRTSLASDEAYASAVVPTPATATTSGPLHVAVVGAGPSGIFAAEELLAAGGDEVRVSIFDRLPVVGGLVRFGVSPDHGHTKLALRRFTRIAQDERVSLFLNVDVGEHVEIAELLTYHHAVIVAVGAAGDRSLGIPGEGLPGSRSARELVAWYNGHPDHADAEWDLSGERVVVIGNGNVAIDVARILTADPDRLAGTDISDTALEALRASKVREVVVVGRRGPEAAAFTFPELVGLTQLTGVAVRATGLPAGAGTPARRPTDPAGLPAALKVGMVADLDADEADQRGQSDDRTIELRFLRSPEAILGAVGVEGIRLRVNVPAGSGLEATEVTEDLECGLVLRSIGYEAQPVSGLPFDQERRTLPHEAGRVTGESVTGVYATGWVKRGPSGVIGTNRTDARETVTSLIEDFSADRLARPLKSTGDLVALVGDRQPNAIGLDGWLAIERHETRLGAEDGRSRRKLLSVAEMERVAGAAT